MICLVAEVMCRFCEHPLRPGAAVCDSCGSLLEAASDIVPRAEPPPGPRLRCPHCQAPVPAGAAVCHSCGGYQTASSS
ncbi:MAG: zinc ribbon domain-containing protein [Bryobacterales bacterium]|nr:zinc ribbon domain-containing protein [Bryobacterales bacterium]